MEQIELKPCGYCGQPPEHWKSIDGRTIAICLTKGCPVSKSINVDALRWNTRPSTIPDDTVDLIIVWEWIRKHGGDINCTSTTRHIVLLGVRHIFICEFKEFATLRDAAAWIRERLGKYDEE
jgi:hypothetical protein